MSDEPIYGGSIDADRLQYSIIDTARPKSKWSIGPEFDITFSHRHQCRIGFTAQCSVWCLASTGERSDVKPTRDPIHLHRAPRPRTAKTMVRIMVGHYDSRKKEEHTVTLKQPPWDKKKDG
jgi:hypothetical protein